MTAISRTKTEIHLEYNGQTIIVFLHSQLDAFSFSASSIDHYMHKNNLQRSL